MTRLPEAKRWMFTRETRLESGEHQIDGYDIEGFPTRLCTADKMIPGTHAFTSANDVEGDEE